MILLVKYFSFFIVIIAFLSISACSLPKIVVLTDPLTAEEHLKLGLSYEKKGLLDEAIRHYEEASKTDARGFLLIGNLYLNQGKYEQAEENYRRAIKKNNKLADAYNNLAWLYYIKGERLDEAEELVRKAMELEKGNQDKVKIYEDTLNKIKTK
ncbi:MAG: tetratricopeptide repeat protein [Thermodesulfovibrio sp.]|nr:tetratricopeptide repeat protein [Thermodesulfovibrio sp.]